MKRFVAALVLAVVTGTLSFSADPPKFPEPTKEHDWLIKAYAGTWDCEGTCIADPSKPPEKMKGTETCKAVGKFWITSEVKGTYMDKPMTGCMTVGYDAAKKKFVGTWIDSMTDHMFTYEGSLDSTGKILTLEAEGPNMMNPGKTAKYRDVSEFKDDNTRTLTSYMQGDDGKWIQMMTMECKKKTEARRGR